MDGNWNQWNGNICKEMALVLLKLKVFIKFSIVRPRVCLWVCDPVDIDANKPKTTKCWRQRNHQKAISICSISLNVMKRK